MEEFSVVGKSIPRLDTWDKVRGRVQYGSDVELPRVLHAKVLRSKYPHARILGIDTSEAEKLPGVKAVITGQDTTKEKVETFRGGIPDCPPVAVDKVRYIGEAVAAVAAEDELTAEEALALIKVDYEELPAVFDAIEAMKPGAPKVHDVERNIVTLHLGFETGAEYGDVAKGFKEADYIFEDTFTTPSVHQCVLEPTVCIATVDGSGKATFWDQCEEPFQVRELVAKALGIGKSKVRIIQKFLAGCFGSAHYRLTPYVITYLLAKKTGRPVRFVNTREEEFMSSSPRNASNIYVKTGVKKDGTLTARHIRHIMAAGAYSGYALVMPASGLQEGAGLYKCSNLKLEGAAVYTNTHPVTPGRSFSYSQLFFGLESHLDRIAGELGMDPMELRLKNVTSTGENIVGQKIASCGIQECIEKVADSIGWREKRAKKQPNRGVGMAIAMGDCVGKESDWAGSIAYIKFLADGRVRIISGEYNWGQGSHTILSQIAAEELGIRLEDIEFSELDTDVLPNTLGPYGIGRLTGTAGQAVRLAAIDAKKKLFAAAGKMLGVLPEDLEMKNQKLFIRGIPEKAVSIADVCARVIVSTGPEIIGEGVYPGPELEWLDLKTAYGNHSGSYAFSATAIEVEVDPETGQVKILDCASASDLGKAMNPMAAEGQVQGGVVFDIGKALMEEDVLERGRQVNPNFTDYKLATAMDVPPIKPFLVESNDPYGPYGAKGFGMSAGTAVTAAVANAVYDAVGVRIRELPITPEKVFMALKDKGEGR